ncbi:MAG: PAS domain S-box protein [Candidatus Lokiarchaeota archaeon]|nr:PAS domain S-box protein [Candidatus Lokiarchaeota archaeon]
MGQEHDRDPREKPAEKHGVDIDARRERVRVDSFLNLVGGIFVVMDMNARIMLINKAGEQMLGYSSGELVGKNWFDHCVPPAARENVRQVFSRLVTGQIEPVEFFENNIITRDGKVRLIAWHNAVLRDEHGQIEGTLSSGHDITEHRHAEDLLKKQARVMKIINEVVTVCNETASFHELLYLVLDTVLDLLGLDGGGIYLVNESTRSGTLVCHKGLPLDFIETVMSANLDDGRNQDLLRHVPIFFEHVLEYKPEMARNWGFKLMAGIPLVSKAHLVGVLNLVSRSRDTFSDEEREILSLLGKNVGTAIERTIAEMDLKESEARYKDAYELASFYKDLFTHDMNNILQCLLSVAELQEFYKHDPGKVDALENLAGTIKLHANRGSKLVSNVRKLSMLEDSIVPIHARNLDDALAESVKYLLKGHPSKKIIVTTTGLTGEKVLANDFLVDIFDNILENAVRYTDRDHITIEIMVSRVVLDAGARVQIAFFDNGIGIPDDIKLTLFTKDRKSGPNKRGMGMGLSLVKKIVDKLGGSVYVEDRVPGDYTVGSKFVVLLRPSS